MRTKTRNIVFTPNINPYAEGSVLAEFGHTKVHITVSIQNEVPHFLKGKGKGWLTAEYSLLPMSTHQRVQRERKKVSGRTLEIQRLIGRALRAGIDFEKLGEKTILVDCDVLVADGGTRTTAISGGYLAVALAVQKLMKENVLTENPLKSAIAAISVGISSENEVLADLNYEEDSSAQTDFNIVMNEEGKFIELQGTAEGLPFSYEELEELLKCGKTAIQDVIKEQKKVLAKC